MNNMEGKLKRTLYTEPLYEEQTGELMDEGGAFIGNKGDIVEVIEFYPKECTFLISNGTNFYAIGMDDIELIDG